MRKKSSVILLLSFLSVLLFGCGSKDVSEYVDVSFKGYDSYGEADVYIDEERLITDLFDVDADTDFVDDETLREIMAIC